jgi:phospholipid/cholesterol/gamma-HCH transport system ATP-binding protein
MIRQRRLILSLENVTLRGLGFQIRDAIVLAMDIHGGDLLLLHLEKPAQLVAIADLCSGLTSPVEGTVRFLGRNWSGLIPDTSNALRGRIGRVYSRGAWIEQQTIRENILMQQLHHTRRPVGEVLEEAALLAKELGLPGLPIGRTSEAMRLDLERSSWVRAFLGSPFLVLLEEPTAEWPSSGAEGLINTVRKARDRGAAVIWMTLQERLLNDPSLPATRRYRLIGRRMMEVNRQ